MTMMALSLCIGLLIDDAIVVRENIVRHVAHGQGPPHRRARGHRRDRPGGDGHHLRASARCSCRWPSWAASSASSSIPFGITVVVAVLVSLFVSFTLDPMLSSGLEGPAVGAPEASCRGIGHADPRHRPADGRAARASTSALIRWVVLARAAGACWLPAFGHAFDADGAARQGAAAALAPRHAHAARRGLAVGGASFVGALGAGAAGGQRVHPADRPGLHAARRSACRWAPAWRAATPRCARSRRSSPAFPEVRDDLHQRRRAGHGLPVGRNQASLNIGLVERSERKRTQKQVEDAIRETIAKIPGIDVSVGFDRPIYVAILGSDPAGPGAAWPASSPSKVQARSRASPTSSSRSSPACRPMRCA